MNVTRRTMQRDAPGKWRAHRLTMGKHRGKSLGELVRDDPAYLAWLAGQELPEWLRAKVDAAVMESATVHR